METSVQQEFFGLRNIWVNWRVGDTFGEIIEDVFLRCGDATSVPADWDYLDKAKWQKPDQKEVIVYLDDDVVVPTADLTYGKLVRMVFDHYNKAPPPSHPIRFDGFEYVSGKICPMFYDDR